MTATTSLSTAEPVVRPTERPDVGVGEDEATEGPWDVIVWDDPVNLMSYVVFVFRKVFGYPEPVARRLMLEVHNEGRALVASEPKAEAESYVHKLHAHGLQATMQQAS